MRGRKRPGKLLTAGQIEKPEPLTNDIVRETSAPASGSITLWDTRVTGFGVRIFATTDRDPKGTRTFFLNYRIDGIERRYTIGRFPTWSVSAARDEAEDLRKLVDQGRDPTREKRERREAPTIQDLVDRYIAEHLPTKTGGKNRINDEKRKLAEIAQRLGKSRKIAEVHFGDLEAMHRAITNSGRPVAANRTLGIASKMFSLSLRPMAGEDKPWRDAAMGNPCKGIARNHEEGRERFFGQAELAAISDALAAFGEAADPRSRAFAQSSADCVRLIMLSGCRPNEALLATWTQFDGQYGYWIKPSAHTKQRKQHALPLSPPALELIERLRKARKRGAKYVFPGAKTDEPIAALWHVWHFVRHHATLTLWATSDDPKITGIVADLERGLGRRPTIDECRTEAERQEVVLPPGLLAGADQPPARLYDLRHTFASVGAGGGLSLPIIGRLLGHTQARTTQRYAHLADDPVREAAEKIGAVISGAGKKIRATVVAIKR
jgi:integrase